MDLYLLAAWIMIWDLIILAVGIIGAYQWHKLTMKEASRLHDEAMTAVPGLVWASLNTPIPDDPEKKTPMDLLRSSICASIDGKIGTYFREVEQRIGGSADPQSAFLSEIVSLFRKDSPKKKK